jgi:TolB-like protein
MDHSKDFWSALRERYLVRVAAIYLGAAWFAIQVTKNLSDVFGAPYWITRAMVGIFVIGLPITLFFSWVYQTTPQHSRISGRRLDRVIGVIFALVVVALLMDRYMPSSFGVSGLGPLTKKQFVICGAVLVVLVLLVGAWAVTRGSNGAVKGEIQSVSTAVSTGTADVVTPGPRIAVLPFANVSGEAALDYFSDGITENITNSLSRFRDLFVISSNSSFTYKNKSVTTQDVSRELGVNYILQGSVQTSGDRIRITVQLVDGVTGGNLWAERYDRGIEDVFAVQDELTELIVGTLASAHGGRLHKAWQGRTHGGGTRNLLALDHFLRGLNLLNNFTKEDTERGRAELQKSAALDPSYAKPLAKISWSYMMDAYLGWSPNPTESWAKALQFAKQAIERDDSEAWGHFALGGYYMFKRQHDQAKSEYLRALDLNPNEADIVNDFGFCLSYAGEPMEGIRLAQKAMRLNPHHPEFYTMQLGQIYFDARMYEQAIVALESLRGEDTVLRNLYLAASHAALTHIDDAKRAIMRALSIDPTATLSRWANAEMAPYKDPQDLEHFRDNLRKSGLPA